jgi:hypothetical protein
MSRPVWLLAAVNALLLLAVAWRVAPAPAWGQRAGTRMECTLIPAKVATNPNGIIYVLETREGLLSAWMFEPVRGELKALEPIDLNRVFAALLPPRPVPGGP